jgi:hypothetical protein
MPVLRIKLAKIMFSHCRHNCPSARLGNICMCVPLSLPPSLPHLASIPGPYLPFYPLGNSRLPDLTQTNLVNIYLFHADSGNEVLRVMNQTNPFGRAGTIAKQVDDEWFPNGGVTFNGSSITYPYYWVITRSDATLDGTEIPLSTFSAVRK